MEEFLPDFPDIWSALHVGDDVLHDNHGQVRAHLELYFSPVIKFSPVQWILNIFDP